MKRLETRITRLEGHAPAVQRIVIVPIDMQTGAALGPGVEVRPIRPGEGIDYRTCIAALAPEEIQGEHL